MRKKGKVTGLGGFFIKSGDPGKLKAWYEQHLGLPCDEHGHLFEWLHSGDPSRKGHTQFSVFEADTKYLDPSRKDYMINFRVDDLVSLLESLREAGMEVVGKMEEYEYGKFAWVMDPDGNKIELWEPAEGSFSDDPPDSENAP